MNKLSENQMTDQPHSDRTSKPVIVASALEKRYQQGSLDVHVLKSLALTIQSAERVAIVGSSGSGKSTLLHILGGLDTPTVGEVSVCGIRMSSLGQAARGKLRNKVMGFVYQFHHLLPEFSALENVSMPLMIGGSGKSAAKKRSAEMLERVGLADRLTHKPAELSGGERQRAAIARALINKPRIVLADEPTGNLDEETAARVYDLMLELNQEIGTSFLVVTHDMRLARRMDRVLRLSSGVLSSEVTDD